MKKLLALLALALVSVATLPVQAATASGQFDVSISLAGTCKYVKTSDVAFTYASFQTGAQSETTAGGFTVQCTKNLTYTLALDSTAVLDAAVDLNYTLALSSGAGTGDGSAQAYSVTGSILANQAGKCATAGGVCTNSTSGNKTRTLTITY